METSKASPCEFEKIPRRERVIQPDPHPISRKLILEFFLKTLDTKSNRTSVSGLGIKTFFVTSISKFQNSFFLVIFDIGFNFSLSLIVLKKVFISFSVNFLFKFENRLNLFSICNVSAKRISQSNLYVFDLVINNE